jgi:hypothetical protein
VFDNAATNDVLVRVLSRILGEKFDIQFVPENSQIRCLAHVVNLVVQKILAVLDEAEDPEVVDYYLPNKNLPFHYDPESDPDLCDLESEQCIPPVEGEADEEEAGAATMTEMAAELASLSPLQKVRRDFGSGNVLIKRHSSVSRQRRSVRLLSGVADSSPSPLLSTRRNFTRRSVSLAR